MLGVLDSNCSGQPLLVPERPINTALDHSLVIRAAENGSGAKFRIS